MVFIFILSINSIGESSFLRDSFSIKSMDSVLAFDLVSLLKSINGLDFLNIFKFKKQTSDFYNKYYQS